jgi:glutamate carboxypeptidase
MAHQILRIHGLSNVEKGTTLNVGVVSGGTKPNVVAAEATAVIDLRVWTQSELDRVVQAMNSLRPVMEGTELIMEGGENRPPLERSATKELFQQAQEIGRKLGLELEEGGTGGASDGNLTGALGIPTLDGLGVPGHGAHADHEHIEVDQIAGRAALLTALVMELE